MSTDSQGRTLRLLVDTNVVIAHEDDDPASPHMNADRAGQLLRLARELGLEILVSAGTVDDFLRAPEPRRSQRRRSLRKHYTELARVATNPAVRASFPHVSPPATPATSRSFRSSRLGWQRPW